MDNHVTLKTVRSRLEEMGMDYVLLPLDGGHTALFSCYGGRLMGPFRGEDGESLLWLSKAFQDKDAFRAFVEARQWNIGGERLWVNPELKFFCESPETFDQTYTVQPELDPGNYTLTAGEGAVNLSMDVTLQVLATGQKKAFRLERRYAPALNPLRYMSGLRELPIAYCGLTQEIILKDTSPQVPLGLEPWILTQINPGGKVVTPYFGPFEFVDYYEAVGELQKVTSRYAELSITGCNKYKVAYRSAQTLGRMAYVRPMGNEWALMVRNYYNDPSIPYISEPWGDLGNRGCSTYYYNDHGMTDGFAEFENSGAVVGPEAGRSQSSSTTALWFFQGGRHDIGQIMNALLGIDYAFPAGNSQCAPAQGKDGTH